MSLSKILLVLKREYMTRVRSKSFILSTLLTPLALVAFISIIVWVSIADSEPQKTVAIVDQTEVLYPRLLEMSESRYMDASDTPVDTLRAYVLSEEIDGYILLNEQHINLTENAELVYGGGGGISFIDAVGDDIRDVIREERLARAEVSDEVRDIFESRAALDRVKLTEEGEEADNTGFAAAFGFILGLIIFMGLFGYGAVLMRSVIEEKTNRIVEVIASSVKPIELMFGKLFGICLLALTQFAIWVIAYAGISIAAAPVAAMIMEAQTANLPDEAKAAAAESFDPSMLEGLVFEPSLFLYFFLFFILGFLIYSALFAAVGAAVDSEQDTQQFMIPIMIPIFIGYFFNTRVMVDPDSTLSVIASLFPLTSPINMITRIAVTEVPGWQIALSIALMIGAFLGIIWLAAKVYRVGILMYGKKPSFGELLKWIKQG